MQRSSQRGAAIKRAEHDILTERVMALFRADTGVDLDRQIEALLKSQ